MHDAPLKSLNPNISENVDGPHMVILWKSTKVLFAIAQEKIFEKYLTFDGFKPSLVILAILWNFKCPFKEEILGK